MLWYKKKIMITSLLAVVVGKVMVFQIWNNNTSSSIAENVEVVLWYFDDFLVILQKDITSSVIDGLVYQFFNFPSSEGSKSKPTN